jgi:ATP-binding cassette subfamily B protein
MTTQAVADTEQAQHDEELRFQLSADQRMLAQMKSSSWTMALRMPRLVRRALALAWSVDARSTRLLLVCQVLSGVLQAGGLLATTGTIAALISSGHITTRLLNALPSIAVLAGAAGLRALLAIAVSSLSLRLSPKVSREAEVLLLETVMRTELSAYDHAGFNDRWDAAERGAQTAQDLLTTAQNVTASIASLTASFLVVTLLYPGLLPLLVLASLPQGIASIKGAAATYVATIKTSNERRALAMLRWYMADKSVADQIRSNTMSGFLLGRYHRAGARVDEMNDQAAFAAARYGVVGAVCGGLASCLVWVALGVLLATGHIGIASAGTAVFALRNASQSMQGIIGYGTTLFRLGLFLDDWSSFLDEAGGHRLQRGTRIPDRPTLIRTDKVCYTYPESERPALDGVTIEVRRGEIIALVGENGSGKTTLSRLLAALFVPTKGTVLWDGTDTRDLDPHSAWSHTAVVPQTHVPWPLSARENITFGQPAPDGDRAVHEAAAVSGADDVIASLRNGLNTLLARSWWGGQELSGGQWQRVTIARAFFRPSALLILDEPTSALDARGEHRVFQGLRRLAEDRGIVLVTHRLQNVAMADRIYVLDKGRVIQQGTYQSLLAQEEGPNLFRELWELQQDREGV